MLFRKLQGIRPLPLVVAAVGTGGGAGLVLASGSLGPVLAGLALTGVAITALMAMSPSVAFLLTTAVVPLERIGRMTADTDVYTISLMRILGVIALLSFLLHAIVRRKRIQFEWGFVLYGVYTLIGICTLAYTTDPLGSKRAASAIVGNLLFYFLTVNVARSYRIVKLAIAVWLTSTVLIGVFTIYQWHAGAGAGELALGSSSQRFATVLQDTSEWQDLETVGRATGPTSHAAVYGINLVMTLPFFAFFLRTRKEVGIRLALACGFFIVLYNIFLANTRMILILTVLLAILFFVTGLVRITSNAILALLLGTVVVAAMVPADVYRRVLDPQNYTYGQSGTLRIRMKLWGVGLEVAKDKWLTGTGIGNQALVPLYIKEPVPDRISLHCEYLETFIEVGLFGSLAFFGFVALIASRARRAAKLFRRVAETRERYWLTIACQLTMLAVLIDGVQVDVFHFPLKGWWLVAGLTCALCQQAHRTLAQLPVVPKATI